MKKIFLLPLIAIGLLMTACGEKIPTNAFKVEAVLADSTLNGKYVYLIDIDTERKLDSTKVDNGKFSIEGTVDTIKLIQVSDNQEMNFNFVLEPGSIKLDIGNYKSSGTLLNDKLMSFKSLVDSLFMTMDFDNTPFVFRQILDKSLSENSDNVIGALAVYEFARELPANRMDSILAKLSPEMRGLKRIKRISEMNEGLKNTAEGKLLIDFTAENLNKEKVSLSDYVGKGKYTLVDFWASWCGGCRAETPTIEAIYKQYKTKGLEVVSVAVWDKPENTLKAIEEDKPSWTQMINCDERINKLYGISYIPCIILFDPDGKIVARNLRGEEMKKKIAEVIL